MLLVYGTAGLALAVLIFGVTLIGSRDPREPGWASDSLVANIYVPGIVALAVLGAACYIQFILTLGSQSLGVKEIGLVIGIAAGSLLLLKLLRIRQRLVDYETAQKSAEIIKPAVFFTEEAEDGKPEPPAKPTSGKKAA